MTVKIARGEQYVGLSTDEKPSNGVNPGARFLETDTKKEFVFSDAGWTEVVQRIEVTGSMIKERGECFDR